MGIEREAPPAASARRLSLRNAAINYRAGWWSVTVQVAKNKSILGAVVGDRVVLNALGQAVAASWRALPTRYPELELFDFVVMPNHFHALLRIHWRAANCTHHLGFLMGRFKGGTSFLYGRLRRAGEIEDIGASLWQRDYWDDLVTSAAEFRGWQRYIRENPAHWSSDRYGACTAHVQGDAELLNRPRVAFVASQGFGAAALKPRKIWGDAGGVERVLISTFTSAQEREALRRALARRRPLIAVFPAGIPAAGALGEGLAAAIREGRALAVSPQTPGSRLNKKIATWCNEFVLKNADEIWVGDLSPNGMLAQMLAGLGRGGEGRLKSPPSIETAAPVSSPPIETSASVASRPIEKMLAPVSPPSIETLASVASPAIETVASVASWPIEKTLAPVSSRPIETAASVASRPALGLAQAVPVKARPAPAKALAPPVIEGGDFSRPRHSFGARGQALMELAVGLFALALVVSALCGFAHYIAKSLRVQNELRVGGRRSDSVEISSWAAQHVFGAETLKIAEKLNWPSTTILK